MGAVCVTHSFPGIDPPVAARSSLLATVPTMSLRPDHLRHPRSRPMSGALGMTRWLGDSEPAWTRAAGGPMLYICGTVESRVMFTRMARRWRPLKLLVAESGELGLRLSQERRLRLVAVDAVLPDIDAVDLVIRLRRAQRTASVPVLVIGHATSPKEHARFIWVGANAYVTRPFDVAALDRTVHHLLASHAAR